MHKNIEYLWTTSEKAKSTHSVEPLDHHSFPVALGNDDNMGALRQLRRMDCRRIIHAADADGLQKTVWPANDFADCACALSSGLEATGSEAGHMQENVG